MKRSGSKGRKVGRVAVLLAAVMAAAWGLAGCSAGSNADKLTHSSADSGAAMNAVSDRNAVAKETKAQPQSSASSAELAADGNGAGTAFGAAAETAPGTAGEEGLNRKIVYKANMTMQVDNYAKAQSALQNLIQLSDGYMLQFSDQKTTTELGGTYTIKVPASGFSGFILQLEKIEHLDFQSNIKGTDVTEEYVDLESRLKARQVVEARLLSFMEKAAKADDLLKFSQELGDVQTEIEQIKGRMRYLDQNVAYSTIDIRLYQEVEPSPAALKKGETAAFPDRLSNALTDSARVLYRLLQDLIVFIAGALPVAAVLAVIGLPLYFGLRRRRGSRAANPVHGSAGKHAALPPGESQSPAASGQSGQSREQEAASERNDNASK